MPFVQDQSNPRQNLATNRNWVNRANTILNTPAAAYPTPPSWPGSVTNVMLADQYGETPDRNVFSFPVDIGPPLESRMSSVPSDIIDGMIRCKTAVEYEALASFYRDTCKDGVLSFIRTHPRTQLAGCIFRFESFKLTRVYAGIVHDVAVRLRYLR